VQNIVRRRWRSTALGAVALSAGLTILSFPATAGNELPQLRVRLADLDLTRPKDVAVAYGRLRWAAAQVCPLADSASYWLRESAQPCVTAAIRQAVQSIGSPKLTAYSQERTEHEAQQAPAQTRR